MGETKLEEALKPFQQAEAAPTIGEYPRDRQAIRPNTKFKVFPASLAQISLSS
jgi:hypothetical protein